MPFANNIAHKNVQLTMVKSRRANDKNIRDGKANVPTYVDIPFDSDLDTTLRRPATYLK